MKYIRLCLSALGLFCFSSVVFAYATQKETALYTPKNHSGLFIGLGGGYNWTQVNSNTSGTLNAVSGSPPTGVFSGNTGDYSDTGQAFYPEARLGYLQYINNCNWLWGVQLLYQYLGTTISTDQNVNLQNFSTNTSDQINIQDTKTKVRNTFLLPIFIGYSIKNSFVYLGVGPSLFETEYDLHSSDTQSALYIGNINNFSDTTKWMWGGAVQAGIAYYLNATWFVNLNYTFAMTAEYTTDNSATFASEVNDGLNTGTLSLSTQQRLMTQEVGFSINKILS